MSDEEKIKKLRQEIDDAINSKNIATKDDLDKLLSKEDMHDLIHEEKHDHATHSGDKFCKTCGEKNPDYKQSETICKNCNESTGTFEEMKKDTRCKNCGSDEAIDFHDSENIDEDMKQVIENIKNGS